LGAKDAIFFTGAGMEDRLEQLFQEWHQLGGAVLLREAKRDFATRTVEEIVADSTSYCRYSGRLTWIVLDWLIRNIQKLDVERLLQATKEKGDLSVLGVLCDSAKMRNPDPRFERIIAGCAPHSKLEVFFHRVARSPFATKLTRENALEVFSRWNYLCSELRYL
jgi:hypothetical protein